MRRAFVTERVPAYLLTACALRRTITHHTITIARGTDNRRDAPMAERGAVLDTTQSRTAVRITITRESDIAEANAAFAGEQEVTIPMLRTGVAYRVPTSIAGALRASRTVDMLLAPSSKDRRLADVCSIIAISEREGDARRPCLHTLVIRFAWCSFGHTTDVISAHQSRTTFSVEIAQAALALLHTTPCVTGRVSATIEPCALRFLIAASSATHRAPESDAYKVVRARIIVHACVRERIPTTTIAAHRAFYARII